MTELTSAALFARARDLFPGGVSSPVRAFRGVGGEPFFVAEGRGARIRDVEGNEYLDYVLSWGPLLFGHAHPRVVAAVTEAAAKGTSFGAPVAAEIRLAELVQRFFPSMERMRFVNSGTEATMSAVRLARGHTGRSTLLKFEGCYHGHGDSFLVKAGSGVATLGLPDSPGVPGELSRLTITVPFNDLEGVRAAFERHGDDIAAVIVEPVVGNAGFIPPIDGFLQGLRDITTASGALLIFDEVMTGFRVAPGGAQERYDVIPDLTTLGKVIGGGLPVGAYGGQAAIMAQIAPDGPVYQAGTLSGNPVAMAAGIAQLELIEEMRPHATLETRSRRLVDGILAAAERLGIPASGGSAGSMWGIFFTAGPVRNYTDARAADVDLFRRYFHGCLRRGVFLAPSAFEAGFLSTEHQEADIDATIDLAAEALAEAVG